MDRFEGIVEIGEWNTRHAVNEALAHGYRLLAIEAVADTGKHPGPAGQFFVRRRVRYVVGRTADVEHWQPEPRPQDQPAAQDVEE